MAKGSRGGKRNTESTASGKSTFIWDLADSGARYVFDPASNDIPLSNSDMQGIVEAYSARNGMSLYEEDEMIDQVRRATQDVMQIVSLTETGRYREANKPPKGYTLSKDSNVPKSYSVYIKEGSQLERSRSGSDSKKVLVRKANYWN